MWMRHDHVETILKLMWEKQSIRSQLRGQSMLIKNKNLKFFLLLFFFLAYKTFISHRSGGWEVEEEGANR